MKRPVVAIIGGEGAMGRELVRFFRREAVRVHAADLHTRVTPEQACKKADIIIFSVPIASTARVIAQLAPLAKKGSLLADVTSIKAPAMKAFEAFAPRHCEILGLHPLCAPSAFKNLKGQVIAVCDARRGPRSRWLHRLFSSHGALLVKTTPKEHDETMAIVQGITHFSAIASGLAFERLKVNLPKTLRFASPVYLHRLAMIGRILNQSAQLYAQIEIENAAMLPAIKAYQQAIGDLALTVAAGDEKEFENYFRRAAKFLGPFKKKAQKLTDAIIKNM